MFHYVLRRSVIAVKQRKFWFLLPVVLTVLFAWWLSTRTPVQYMISSKYEPDSITTRLTSPSGRILSERELWREALNRIPLGRLFVSREVHSFPHELKRRVLFSMGLIKSPSVVGVDRVERIFQKGRKDVEQYVASRVSMTRVSRSKNALDAIEFSYVGEEKELGEALVGFFAEHFVPMWQSRLEGTLGWLKDRGAAGVTALDKEGSAVEFSLSKYEFWLSVLGKDMSPIEVKVIPTDVSCGYLCLPVIACALLCIIVVAAILVALEFAGRTFTTELQISGYVDVPLVGALPHLEYLSRDVALGRGK